MKFKAWLGGLVALAVSCTSPNPRSCSDGSCTDPSLPFCDTDGALSGTPGTCISVDCAPNTFETCRGDLAVTCNAQGTNYDLMTCQGTCDVGAGGCVGCVTSAECTATGAPFCDPANHSCRKCEQDSECASDLCDVAVGACVDGALITYASPQGTGGTCGTKAMPCSLSVAFTHVDATHHIIKLEPGAYSGSNLTITSAVAELHGAGATISTATGSTFKVEGSASLTVLGATILNASTTASAIAVTGNGATATFVKLHGATLHTAYPLIVSAHTLQLDRSTISWDPTSPDGTGIRLSSNSQATIRRSVLERGGITVANSQFHVSNSIFRDTTTSAVVVADSLGGMNDISFSTFINAPLDMFVAPPIVTLSSNIHSGAGPVETNVVTGTAFIHHYALMNPQAAAPANSDHVLLNVDPKFASTPASDYHLLVGSPAIDAADPGATLAEDFDGRLRPVGAARDLGAFEYKP